MKFLIVSTNALGDTYLSTSAIESMHNVFPDSEIYILSHSSSEFFLNRVSGIEKCFYLDSKKIGSVLKLLFQIRKFNFNYVFVFFPGLVNTFYYLFTKAEKKIGYINFLYTKSWHNKNHRLTINFLPSRFQWLSNQNYLERINLALIGGGFPSKPLFKSRFQNIVKNSDESDYIVIHANSKEFNKSLSLEAVFGLINYFNTFSFKVKIIKGDEITFADNNIHPVITKYEVINAPEIEELVAILFNAKLFIGVDSFPIHIADAYDTNFVGIFGPTKSSSVLQNIDCGIDFFIDNLSTVTSHGLIKSIEDKVDELGFQLSNHSHR